MDNTRLTDKLLANGQPTPGAARPENGASSTGTRIPHQAREAAMRACSKFSAMELTLLALARQSKRAEREPFAKAYARPLSPDGARRNKTAAASQHLEASAIIRRGQGV
jgi:hypothetical protein